MVQLKNNLFRQILWFRDRRKFDLEDLYDLLQPRREVSNDRRYKSGVFRSENCGRYIQYESAMELEFIKRLEQDPGVLFYWEQPVRVPYWRGNVKAHTYPDFAVYTRSHHFIIVEVKPLAEMLDHRVQAKTEGLMEFCYKRNFDLLLTDGRNTPKHLLNGRVNRKLEKEIMAALESGVIRKNQCRDIMQRCGATLSELHRAIIRLDLKYKPFPFKLQRGNQSPVFRQVYFEKKKYDDLVQEKFTAFFVDKNTQAG